MVTIEDRYFSVPQICGSGQCFRLDPVSENSYELTAGGRYLKIRTETAGNEEDPIYRTTLFCRKEEYESFWKRYFDLDTSYEAYRERIAPDDEYLRKAAQFGRGIRILRQDTWEMILTFILSQQNNIPRIKGLIHALSERYGEKKTTEDGTVFYAFPRADRLAGVCEEELRAMKLGYRSRYICGTARMITEKAVDIEALSDMEYESARAELMRLPGIGGKVADCICLFALHHLEAFPVDTHIRQALELHYKRGFPARRYRGMQGILQQYIFYYELKGKKEAEK